MLRKLGPAIIVTALLLGAVPLFAHNQGPLSRVADQWEMGCVSCHSASVMGETLDVALTRSGHPDVSRAVAELPEGCARCHRDGALAPLVHMSHYPSNAAADAPAMPCLACHRMSPSGMPESKTAPKNW